MSVEKRQTDKWQGAVTQSNTPSRNLHSIGLLALFVSAGIGIKALASANAYDDASNSAYNSGWAAANANTSSGTWGGGWTFASNNNSSQSGFFVASSTNNDGNGNDTGGNINKGSRAWGMYANSGGFAQADRSFGGASPTLSIGEKFNIDMDNGDIANGSKVGFALLDSSNNFVFEFRYIGFNSNGVYSIYDGGTKDLNDSGKVVGFTRGGLRLSFELTSSNGYTLTILRPNSSGTAIQYLRTLTTQAGTTISKVRLFNSNAGSGGNSDAFFNSISIPEPTTFSAIGGMLIALVRRRPQRAG